ncbi:MAG TPA: hypothetical protein VFG69_09555 [Nannocystaceae bacterium]|nr:hypothetical protein [Nannocystaceae bacterium]
MAALDTIPRSRLALAGVAIAIVVLASAWLRTPGFTQGGFASHDVAGILYNAMLLHDGELPYVADIELKAPGAFLIAFVLAGDDGTDIARLQVWANLWALASVVATAVLAGRLFGAAAAVAAAVIVALVDAHLDSMDANYVTWTQLPMVLAWTWAFAATQREGAARRLGFAAAGALAGAATLVKQQEGIMLLGIAVCAASPRVWAGSWRAGLRDGAAVVVGAILVHVPLVLLYAVHGELGALAASYPLSRWGVRYVVSGGRDGGLVALREGVLATAYFLALPLALAYPRLAWPWFLPLAMWFVPGTENGEPWQTALALAVAAATISLSELVARQPGADDSAAREPTRRGSGRVARRVSVESSEAN